MKQVFLKFFKFHIIPIFIAIGLTLIFLFVINNYFVSTNFRKKIIKGNQLMDRGLNVNCTESIQKEIELASSLSNPNYLTIFGSSELTNESPYQSYNFLPDSLNIPTVAFGHAFHQSFSMYCELLAMKNNIKNSKICIFISPGWFETEGTNIESFLEFVRPNFLNSISRNNNVSLDDKIQIGEYLSKNKLQIDKPSKSIQFFQKLNEFRNKYTLLEILSNTNINIKNVNYITKIKKNKTKKLKNVNFELTRLKLQNKFIESNKSNDLYIDDAYFNQYLVDEKGKYKPGKIEVLNLATNQEFKDLKLLISLLKRYHCKASFVIQPLNTYHYSGLENFRSIIDSTVDILNKNKFPFLNMFAFSKEEYQPGTLNDIMHVGDYGWMRINQFLYNTYNK